MSLHDKINSGYYSSQKPYPRHPTSSTIADKKAGDLTDSQVFQLIEDRNTLPLRMQQFELALKEYQQDQLRLEEEFWNDVCEENGISPADIKSLFVQKMCRLAWEQGHSSGYGDVAYYFGELTSLYELWKNK